MSHLFSQERPRERCLSQGPESLSLRECLAVLLGTGPKGIGCMGIAANLLRDNNNQTLSEDDFFRFFQSNVKSHIGSQLGLGPAGKARLLVTFELAKRYWRFKQREQKGQGKALVVSELEGQLRKRIPEDFRYAEIEHFGIIALLASGKLSSFIQLGSGDDVSVAVSTRQLFQTLIYLKAESFWFFHNHPNGSLIASPEDLELTKQLNVLARIVGIFLNGHWIVSGEKEAQC